MYPHSGCLDSAFSVFLVHDCLFEWAKSQIRTDLGNFQTASLDHYTVKIAFEQLQMVRAA